MNVAISFSFNQPLKIKSKQEKLFMGPSQSTRQTSVIIGYAYIKYINYYVVSRRKCTWDYIILIVFLRVFPT